MTYWLEEMAQAVSCLCGDTTTVSTRTAKAKPKYFGDVSHLLRRTA